MRKYKILIENIFILLSFPDDNIRQGEGGENSQFFLAKKKEILNFKWCCYKTSVINNIKGYKSILYRTKRNVKL